jgi:PhzF family phenazine biosynthesis protein
MQRFANWTNLSETTFLLPPTDPAADYRVRIFTPSTELPFAGHPTLGSCRAWLAHSGSPTAPDTIVQECGVGLVSIRRDGDRLAFAAPDLIRSGPVDDGLLAPIEAVVGVDVIDAEWGDNGPGWVVAEVRSADVVVALKPDFANATDLKLGVVGRVTDESPSVDYDVEVRAFFPGPEATHEDPVTGSLNAAVAQWLMGRDPELTSYVARQGSVLGRDGRVYLDREFALFNAIPEVGASEISATQKVLTPVPAAKTTLCACQPSLFCKESLTSFLPSPSTSAL